MNEPVRRALATLGIERLVLGVHDASLPADARDDIGRGAPLSLGGRAFLRFAAERGFDGIQLGPQGETTTFDPSPYDGTIFSRSTLSIALGPLVEEGLLPRHVLDDAVASRPAGSDARAAHGHAFAVQRRALAAAFSAFEKLGPGQLASNVESFAAEHADWLERDGSHAALAAEHGDDDWLRWPEADRDLWRLGDATRLAGLKARHGRVFARHRFEQFLAHRQHEAFHAEARAHGLRLYGDLQVGISHQDVWSWAALLLPGFRIGAPPSRTNPEGQPWNYGVLDPDLYGSPEAPGPSLRFVRRRMGKLLSEFDGLRIDHPHGMIDPWVYRAGQTDQLRAVQQGSRLFSSPDRPELARLAVATRNQLDSSLPRHADGWVRDLRDEQVGRYAILFDAVVAAAREHGRAVGDLVCEVLSTQPHPVARVLQRHGLGRFRVTQKAGLDDPRDVYRGENAAPADWIMAGNHDTPSIWSVAERWVSTGAAAAQAAYLAERLVPKAAERPAWISRTARDPLRLARAKLAELFVGPARNVYVFFPDLLGMIDTYNRPGIVGEDNWTLRVPTDVGRVHGERSRRGAALDLAEALATAMRARGPSFIAAHAPLLEHLERERSRER